MLAAQDPVSSWLLCFSGQRLALARRHRAASPRHSRIQPLSVAPRSPVVAPHMPMPHENCAEASPQAVAGLTNMSQPMAWPSPSHTHTPSPWRGGGRNGGAANLPIKPVKSTLSALPCGTCPGSDHGPQPAIMDHGWRPSALSPRARWAVSSSRATWRVGSVQSRGAAVVVGAAAAALTTAGAAGRVVGGGQMAFSSASMPPK